MTIPVVVLNWNGLDDTLECVDALLQMDHPDFRVIVVDNGSDGDDYQRLAAAFSGEPRVEIRRNETNLGFTRGMNRELERLIGQGVDYIALLNNDAVPDRNWLSALDNCARESGAPMVASRLIRYQQRNLLDNAGHIMLNTGEILPRGTSEPPEKYSDGAELIGGCAGAVLMSTDLLRTVGVFDPYFRTGYEDAEFGLRAFLAGFPTRYCPEAVVYHKVSQSIDKLRNFEFAVKIQQDINYTYFKLMPLAVIVVNSPFIAIKQVGVLLASLLLLRWRLLRVQWTALVRTFGEFSRIIEARRAARRLRRISVPRILRAQQFFLWTYLKYFRRYVLGGRQTVFER